MSDTPELPPLPGRACDCKHPDTVSVDPRTHGGYPFQCKVCGVNFSPRALPGSDTGKYPALPEALKLWTESEVSYHGRECWEAGRRAGLEEAAKLCETVDSPWQAEAIREKIKP